MPQTLTSCSSHCGLLQTIVHGRSAPLASAHSAAMSKADLPEPTTATRLPLTSAAASASFMSEKSMEWSTRPRNASGPTPGGNSGMLGTPLNLPMHRIRKSNSYVCVASESP